MSLVWSYPLLDLRSRALNPTEDRGWVNGNATLLHHLGEIAIADPVFAGPPHAQQDDLDRKATALEQRQQSDPSTGRLPLKRQG
jgi:hypothetical protein